MSGTLKAFTDNLIKAYEEAGGKGSPFVTSLADRCGVTPRTIHKLLEGSEPSLGLALVISEKLGLDIKKITAEDAAIPAPRKPSPDEIRLACISLLFKINDKDVSVARNLLEKLTPENVNLGSKRKQS